MSKTLKIWLITATILVIAGLLVFIGIFVIKKPKLEDLETFETNTYEIQEDFTGISIETFTSDIVFMKAEGSICKVECREDPKMKHTVTVKDKILVINSEEAGKWYETLDSVFSFPKITVYLPPANYDSLSVKSVTGNIVTNREAIFGNIDIKSDTGNVELLSFSTGDASVKTSTGNVTVEGISVDGLKIVTSTGDISVTDLNCKDKFEANALTGNIGLCKVRAVSVLSHASNGNLKMQDLICDSMSFIRNTGNIEFTACDSKDIEIKTTTGDVKGQFLSAKRFTVNTGTGKVKVQSSESGDSCRVTTVTGDIKIETGN